VHWNYFSRCQKNIYKNTEWYLVKSFVAVWKQQNFSTLKNDINIIMDIGLLRISNNNYAKAYKIEASKWYRSDDFVWHYFKAEAWIVLRHEMKIDKGPRTIVWSGNFCVFWSVRRKSGREDLRVQNKNQIGGVLSWFDIENAIFVFRSKKEDLQ
jgi:hypothetical protein